LDVKNLLEEIVVPLDNPVSPLRKMSYEAITHSEVVEAVFIKNVETSEVHLIDAWVKTK
jgi:hypothetical protein